MSHSTSGPTGATASVGPSDFHHTTHDNQVVALYATDGEAQAAKAALLSNGFAASAIQVVSRDSASRDSTSGAGTTVPGSGDEGLWGAVRSLFVPDEDRNSYSHAVGHGHAMLVVTTAADMDRAHLMHVLETTHPVDFDAKMQEWQATGYDYSQPHEHYAAATQSAGGAAPVGFASGTGAVASTGSAPLPASTAGMAGAGTTLTGSSTGGTSVPTATAGRTVEDSDTLQVVQESLRVGKREVAAGAVRIRSYVVERPVEEQVRLREEHVSIDRRPVDRPLAGTDLAAFEERTIEARAMSEQAVVTKEARVVEEIGLRKEATERTETVRDTVRSTEVEIDDTTAVTGIPDTRPLR